MLPLWAKVDGNEGVLCLPQSSSITGTSPSDCLVSYPGHSLGVLPLCRLAVGVFYSSSRLGNTTNGLYFISLKHTCKLTNLYKIKEKLINKTEYVHSLITKINTRTQSFVYYWLFLKLIHVRSTKLPIIYFEFVFFI